MKPRAVTEMKLSFEIEGLKVFENSFVFFLWSKKTYSMDLVGYRFYLGLKNRPFVK